MKQKGCIDEPDAPKVKVLVANPREGKWRYKRNSPCILIIPGGGLTTCFRFTAAIEDWADKYGVPVATFNYRTLCMGAQYPQPMNDCEAAYNFLTEHAKELNRYHRGKRIVMGNRNAEGKVPVSNWKKYLKNATEEKETLEAEKKEVLEKLRPLQKVQRSVDLVMMEIEDQPDPENLLVEEKTACRDQIQKKDRVKKKSYGVEL